MEQNKDLATELRLVFPLLSDRDLNALRAWGVADEENGIAWPALYVVDQSGRIAWRSLAETYKKRPAAAEVLSALDALPPKAPAARPPEGPVVP